MENTENIMTEKNNREKALMWWNEFNYYKKQRIVDEEFGFGKRLHVSLTGREIEKIWEKEVNYHKQVYVEWLEQRIAVTTQEQLDATELNIRIGKGGKLKAYKEVLEFIKQH
jgi:hypothetical protein